MKLSLFLGAAIVGASLAMGCAPVTSTRIGPPVSPKSEDCDMEILEAGKTPTRPYRDVGMVSLKNCPEYDTGACKKWLRQEACRLGGDVVYLPHKGSVDDRPETLAGGVTYTLTVAAYVGQMAPTKDDAVLNSTPAEPCDVSDASDEETDAPEDQMCTE
ncbi:MAG: hypothetical protein JXR76_08930 [Deltaproteobacteria bacterium]|nr:hypothetical protein [Deltaproteobacteria bacterium]